MQMTSSIRALVTLGVGAIIWFIPTPHGLTQQAWHVFAITAATILGFIVRPLPMGAMALCGITFAGITNTLKLDQILSGFSNSSIWLIVAAFCFTRGFIKTGLGRRIAYTIMRKIGHNSLLLGYSLSLSDMILAVTTPSSTARAGGILYPIIRGLSTVFDSEPGPSSRRIGAFLLMTIYQVETTTCAMFMTAMAGNPFMVSVAKGFGINLTWGSWALAAILPGLVSLAVVPLFLYIVYPPEVKRTPQARELANAELRKLGPTSAQEKYLLIIMAGTLVLWSTAQFHSIDATRVALCAVIAMLLGKVLDWNDVIRESGAWDTMIWMGSLITLAGQLNATGFIPWFSQMVAGAFTGIDWVTTMALLLVVYMYTQYFFASATAHAVAMYGIFIGVGLAAGAPPLLMALSLAFVANNCFGLTHYSCGYGPIYFGAGFFSLGTLWSLGFYVSVINLIIWVGLGSVWWKILGLW